MNNKQIIEFLKEEKIILENNKISQHINRKIKVRPYINDMLKLLTPHLDDDANHNERLYHIIYNLKEKVTCKICNNPVKFHANCVNRPELAYNMFCSRKCKATHLIENGTYEKIHQKMKKTRSKIDEDGLNSFQKYNNGINSRISNLNNIDENGLNGYQRAAKNAESTFNTIDSNTGLTKRQMIGLKSSKTKSNNINENGLNTHQRIARDKNLQKKRRKANEKNNLWVPLNKKTKFALYRRDVSIETRKQPIKKLENYNLRGKYHLDHIVSIYYGFKNNIPPNIIGHITNLRYIPAQMNCSKHTRSDMTIEELYKKIKEYELNTRD